MFPARLRYGRTGDVSALRHDLVFQSFRVNHRRWRLRRAAPARLPLIAIWRHRCGEPPFLSAGYRSCHRRIVSSKGPRPQRPPHSAALWPPGAAPSLLVVAALCQPFEEGRWLKLGGYAELRPGHPSATTTSGCWASGQSSRIHSTPAHRRRRPPTLRPLQTLRPYDAATLDAATADAETAGCVRALRPTRASTTTSCTPGEIPWWLQHAKDSAFQVFSLTLTALPLLLRCAS